MNNKQLIEILVIIVLLGIGRLAMTFVPNFNPIGAMALFGGAVLASRKLSYIIPIGALLIGDLVYSMINPLYADYMVMKYDYSILFVYLAFILTALMGRTYLSGNRNYSRILGVSLASGVMFFIVSNFGSWIGNPAMYSQDFTGLMACYGAGLAFYKNDITQNFFLNGVISTTLFSVLAFYAYDLSEKWFNKPVENGVSA